MGQRPCLQAHGPQLPLLPGENHLILSAKSDVLSVLPSGYFLSPWHEGWRGTGGIDLPYPL
jgi:hypothetical protein